MNSLTIGTRGSPLALAQAKFIGKLLATAHPSLQVETKIIKTSGDQFTNLSLVAGGGKGLFTKEIEDQLLREEIHIAVHSLKDLPTILPDGLTIGAVPVREDARDVFISRKFTGLDELPRGATVATSSIRRRAQLLARRPDLHVEEIRGNVDTRLRKLKENDELDATILAMAGLRRLDLWRKDESLHWQPIEFDVMIPAVGQGAIGVEVRADDKGTRGVLAKIDHADTHACVQAERALLRALGGGCQVPYAAHATATGSQLRLVGAVFSDDGKQVRRAEATGDRQKPVELGERVARELLK